MIGLINGKKIILREFVVLVVMVNDRKHVDKFYILRGSIADLLICRKIVEDIMNGKEFPVECKIPTRGEGIVSWSRPIRSLQEKEEFQDLVKVF